MWLCHKYEWVIVYGDTQLSHAYGLLNQLANCYGLLLETNCETAKLAIDDGFVLNWLSPRKGNSSHIKWCNRSARDVGISSDKLPHFGRWVNCKRKQWWWTYTNEDKGSVQRYLMHFKQSKYTFVINGMVNQRLMSMETYFTNDCIWVS